MAAQSITWVAGKHLDVQSQHIEPVGEVQHRASITGYRSLASLPTFPLDAADRQLDHILVRGSLGEVRGSGAPALPLPDHRALFVDVD